MPAVTFMQELRFKGVMNDVLFLQQVKSAELISVRDDSDRSIVPGIISLPNVSRGS
jgi:hypothetical protein